MIEFNDTTDTAPEAWVPPALEPLTGEDVRQPAAERVAQPWHGMHLRPTVAGKDLFFRITGRRRLAPFADGQLILADVMLWLYLCAHDCRGWWTEPEPEPIDLGDGSEPVLVRKAEIYMLRVWEWAEETFPGASDAQMAEAADVALAVWDCGHRTYTVPAPDGRSGAQKKTPSSAFPTGPQNTDTGSPPEIQPEQSESSSILT